MSTPAKATIGLPCCILACSIVSAVTSPPRRVFVANTFFFLRGAAAGFFLRSVLLGGGQDERLGHRLRRCAHTSSTTALAHGLGRSHDSSVAPTSHHRDPDLSHASAASQRRPHARVPPLISSSSSRQLRHLLSTGRRRQPASVRPSRWWRMPLPRDGPGVRAHTYTLRNDRDLNLIPLFVDGPCSTNWDPAATRHHLRSHLLGPCTQHPLTHTDLSSTHSIHNSSGRATTTRYSRLLNTTTVAVTRVNESVTLLTHGAPWLTPGHLGAAPSGQAQRVHGNSYIPATHIDKDYY